MQSTERTIQVNTGSPYQITISRGILNQIGERIRPVTKAGTIVIVSDDNVNSYYGDMVEHSLQAVEFRTLRFVFPHGEASKCSTTLNQLYDYLCENSLTRTDCLVALGGGVVGDLTGFAAATYLRGMDYVQVPTSLLAQVDSSVGGKTAIDLPGGKNLVGAFKQPKAVLIDPNTLQTLPKEFLCDGMGEVIKYGMIRDAKLFAQLENLTLETIPDVIDDIIYTCVDIKREVVEHDEFDTGERMILNYGHTLGHAVESYYHYQTYSHGCAVAAGMCMMAEKTCTPEIAQRLKQCVLNYQLPATVPASLKELVPLCGKDKKRANATLRFIACPTPGVAEIRSMDFADFSKWLTEEA